MARNSALHSGPCAARAIVAMLRSELAASCAPAAKTVVIEPGEGLPADHQLQELMSC